MNLAAKHEQKVITYSDFKGGLNTTTVSEMIADNQMADCINMEFNRTTGALQTCCGTNTVFTCPSNITIDQLWYDMINNIFLFTDTNTRAIYKTNLVNTSGVVTSYTYIGTLTGTKTPSAAMWENGMVIASGGRLQYWNGSSLETIQVGFDYEQTVYEWTKLGSSITSKTWASGTTYAYGNIVKYSGGYYYCINAHTASSSFDTDNWQKLTINGAWAYDTYYSKNVDVVTVDSVYYLAGVSHTSITDAPTVCNGVFVKNGRIAVWYKYTIQFSGIGDEKCWYDVSDDDSTSKYQDVGYKEGENEQAYIIGACALSSDTIILKNNGTVYRLANEYPDWSLKEIARDVSCLNPRCYVSIQDGVFIVGSDGMFMLQTTIDYGDIKPTNVANGVIDLLGLLSVTKSYVKFMPSLNQIWIAGTDNKFICFDLTFKAFFQRSFNAEINDICRYKSYFMLTRNHSVAELTKGVYTDSGKEMSWKVIAKTQTSFYDFLLKRIRIAYVPLMDSFNTAQFITGNDKIKINLPARSETSARIATDTTEIATDNRLVFPMSSQFVTKRMVWRNMTFGIKLEGTGSAIMLNRIDCAVAEV